MIEISCKSRNLEDIAKPLSPISGRILVGEQRYASPVIAQTLTRSTTDPVISSENATRRTAVNRYEIAFVCCRGFDNRITMSGEKTCSTVYKNVDWRSAVGRSVGRRLISNLPDIFHQERMLMQVTRGITLRVDNLIYTLYLPLR